MKNRFPGSGRYEVLLALVSWHVIIHCTPPSSAYYGPVAPLYLIDVRKTCRGRILERRFPICVASADGLLLPFLIFIHIYGAIRAGIQHFHQVPDPDSSLKNVRSTNTRYRRRLRRITCTLYMFQYNCDTYVCPLVFCRIY